MIECDIWSAWLSCAWLGTTPRWLRLRSLRSSPLPSSDVDLGISEWFSQGETVWSHNASGLDPNLGNPQLETQIQRYRHERHRDHGTSAIEE